MPSVASIFHPESLGIRRYAEGLSKAVGDLGWTPASEEEADIVHVHYGNSSRQLARLAAPKRRPMLVTFHDVLPRQRLLRLAVGARLARAWYRKAGAGVVHNALAAQLLPRATRIPMWAFASSVAADPVPPHDGLRVGVFGKYGPHKGLGWVREAAGLLDGSGVRFVLCGRGMQQAQSDWDFRDAEVVESPADQEFDRRLAGIDVLVGIRTDRVGESSAVVPQALAAGVPVIANPDGVEVGAEPATLVVQDPAALARCLADLQADPGRLAELRARTQVAARSFALPTVAARYAACYAGLLEG